MFKSESYFIRDTVVGRRLLYKTMKKIFDKFANNWSVAIALCFFAVSSTYLAVVRDDVYLVVFDNLDSVVTWYKMLRDNNLFWTLDTQVPFLGGISRNYLYSDIKLYSFLYMLFPNLLAFIIGWYLRIVISMVGFALLGNTVFGEDKDNNIPIFCGFLYGILPVYPTFGIEFASLPFLMSILIKLYRKWNWNYLIILFFYPIVSAFSEFGIFICGYIALFVLIDWGFKKKISQRLVLGIVFLILGYVITEWRLFYVMLFSNIESIRTTFSLGYVGWKSAINTLWKTFVFGESAHAGSSHTFVILPICLGYFAYLNCGYVKSKDCIGAMKDPFNWIMIWQVINYAVYSFDRMIWFRNLMSTLIPPLKGFSYSRTVWFAPFAWYFAFMIVMCRASCRKNVKNLVCLAAFLTICLYPSIYNHILWNTILAAKRITRREQIYNISVYEPDMLSYREFYSYELFDRIKSDIGYDGQWAVAFGMHPAVLNYNGIATLDGYLSYYPREYKDQFRKLIKPDFDVDSGHEEYYETYGGRAYIFSKDVSYTPYRFSDVTEADMLIDPSVFREMKGKYVFSRVEITNTDELGIEKLGVYEDLNSPYTIYVYETR